jgi:dienelactone hydrolase
MRRCGCHVPVLIVRAGRDSPTVNRTVAAFIEAALANEVAIDLLNHPDAGPGFEVRNDDARSREIIARTLEFIRVRAAR